MSFIDYAQFSTTIKRGYEICKAEKVKGISKVSSNYYAGIVTDLSGASYNVRIDTRNPMRSHCNCPVAIDKKYLCEHEIALYFSIYPEKAERFAKVGYIHKPSHPQGLNRPLNDSDDYDSKRPVIRRYKLDGEYIKEYPDIDLASEDVGVSSETIKRTILGLQHTCAGSLWKRVQLCEPKVDLSEEEVNELYVTYKNKTSILKQSQSQRKEKRNIEGLSWQVKLARAVFCDYSIVDLSEDQLAGLDSALEILTEQECDVLVRYYQGASPFSIAEFYGVSRERIRQIEAKALRKLRNPKRSRLIIYGLEGYNKMLKDGLIVNPLEIDGVEFSIRSYYCLKRAGINSLEDIIKYDKEIGLEKIRSLGKKSAAEIRSKISNRTVDRGTQIEE